LTLFPESVALGFAAAVGMSVQGFLGLRMGSRCFPLFDNPHTKAQIGPLPGKWGLIADNSGEIFSPDTIFPSPEAVHSASDGWAAGLASFGLQARATPNFHLGGNTKGRSFKANFGRIE